jgi:threonine synthase
MAMKHVAQHDLNQTYELECSRCQWRCAPVPVFRCPSCGGALEARTDLARATIRPPGQPEVTYFDLLPLDNLDHLDAGIARATPCRPASALGRSIGVPQLWIKDETRQPTGSTKDRLAAIVTAVFRQLGVDEFVTSSTGNTAVALARAVQRDGAMRAYFFGGTDFSGGQRIERGDRVHVRMVDGSYAEVTRQAQEFAERHGIFWEGGFFNWARREGLKLAYLEALDAMPAEPTCVVQAISSGMGMMAAHKGLTEYQRMGRLSSMPRFIMVQQDTCAPMADAWRAGRAVLTDDDVVANPRGLARAILLGDGRATYPYMHRIATDTGGSIVSVTQRELVEARGWIREYEGIDACYSSSATVAAVEREARADRLGPDDIVLVNLTGRHNES